MPFGNEPGQFSRIVVATVFPLAHRQHGLAAFVIIRSTHFHFLIQTTRTNLVRWLARLSAYLFVCLFVSLLRVDAGRFRSQYRDIVQDEFLPEVTSSEKVIVHFYHKDFAR